VDLRSEYEGPRGRAAELHGDKNNDGKHANVEHGAFHG